VDMREPAEKRRPIRGTVEDPVRGFHAKTFTNRDRSKVKVVVPKLLKTQFGGFTRRHSRTGTEAKSKLLSQKVRV
jgi:hypothetical protein